MGAQLVARVYTYWADLPDRPFRLLVHMALTVKDATKEPTYWGGREAMAQALGLPPHTLATHQTVKMAVRRLVDEGAIQRVVFGHAGKRSEYRLILERGNAGLPLRGNESVPQRGNSRDPQRGNESVPPGVTLETPLGTYIRKTEENEEEDQSPSKVTFLSRKLAAARSNPQRPEELAERIDRETS